SEYLRSGDNFGLGVNTLGFLDPSRLSFSHSYTMTYMASGNDGVARGLFMETIGYQLSRPVTLTFNVGYLHQPYSSYGPDGPLQSGTFVGGAALTWRPSDNMFLHFEVANFPSYPGVGYYPNGMFRPGYSPTDPLQLYNTSNSNYNPPGE
ncbi:MAG: hypothetical protein ABH878_03460, partial [bacterium]